MIKKLANKTARYLVQQQGFENRFPVVSYGLEVIYGAALKSIFFIIIPFILGVGPQTLVAVGVSGLLRLFSGGAHCKAYYRCVIGTLLLFITAGFIAKNWPQLYSPYLMLTVAALVGLILLRCAPADTPNKPINNPNKKKRLKRLSLLVLAVYLLVVFLQQEIPNSLLLAGTFGLIIQGFTVTPLGYHVLAKYDQLIYTTCLVLTGRRLKDVFQA